MMQIFHVVSLLLWHQLRSGRTADATTKVKQREKLTLTRRVLFFYTTLNERGRAKMVHEFIQKILQLLCYL